MSGITTSLLSLAWSLWNWLILDYEEANGQTVRPWAPFLLSLGLMAVSSSSWFLTATSDKKKRKKDPMLTKSDEQRHVQKREPRNQSNDHCFQAYFSLFLFHFSFTSRLINRLLNPLLRWVRWDVRKREREASVRLGHKSLRTLMKRSSSWYLPGDFIFNS